MGDDANDDDPFDDVGDDISPDGFDDEALAQVRPEHRCPDAGANLGHSRARLHEATRFANLTLRRA